MNLTWIVTGIMQQQEPLGLTHKTPLEVDDETLIMMSTERCILGQVFDRDAYHDLCDKYGSRWIVDHGFVSPKCYWLKEIEKRKT